MARALVTARAHEEFKRVCHKDSRYTDDEKNVVRKTWENVRKGDATGHIQQRVQAQRLMQDAGLGEFLRNNYYVSINEVFFNR
jgi:Zn-dependent M28 family amino/carboxypeptidase